MPLDKYRAANRARWDEAVAIHAASAFYGVDRFLAGESTLLPLDRESVGPVAGKTLLHLQCHFGLDTLSWARAGASVTGLDFSAAAIAQARALAAQAGLAARFIEAELYDAPSVLEEQFDIVYVNLGALTWLPDVRGWAQVAAGFVRPGGLFYLHEVHPMLYTIDDERSDLLAVRYPYFEQREPLHFEGAADYASERASFEHTATYEWSHGLGEIVNALIAAGLAIESLDEHDWTVYRALPGMNETSPGVWRLPGNPIPLAFSLRARK